MNLINEFNIKCDTTDKINKFKNFLLDKINNKSFIEYINQYVVIIKNIKITNKHKFIYKTFRMSVI